jgi:hypothetical protein
MIIFSLSIIRPYDDQVELLEKLYKEKSCDIIKSIITQKK